jgi:hypothetical protein
VKSPFSQSALFGLIVCNMSESPSHDNCGKLSHSGVYARVPQTGHFPDGV